MRKDKPRDIARGVLPSTARKGARDNKRAIHNAHRGAQRQACRAIERHLSDVDDDGNLYTDVDLYDDFEGREIFDGYDASTTLGHNHMKYVVSDRRGADNLGPLLNWARATERQKMDGWSNEDKYAYFKAVLPDTLQGRHALGHVESALDISNDEFLYGGRRYYSRFKPTTRNEFRNALDRILAKPKARRALRDFIYEAVPVAAHRVNSNLKTKMREQARDENGDLVTITSLVREYDPLSQNWFTVSKEIPKMVDVYVPETISTTCDDCTFVRNDPLATGAAVDRFVNIVWAGRTRFNAIGRRLADQDNPHFSFNEIIRYVTHDYDG